MTNQKCVLNINSTVYNCKSVIKFKYNGKYACYPCTVIARIPQNQLKAIVCQSCGTGTPVRSIIGIAQCQNCSDFTNKSTVTRTLKLSFK